MEDLLREILAPLSPTFAAAAALPLPAVPRLSPEGAETQKEKGTTATSQVTIKGDAPEGGSESGREMGVGMDLMDFGMGMRMDANLNLNVGLGGGEQWTTNDLEMQRLFESLEAYQKQQSSLDLELDSGWPDAFNVASDGFGASVDVGVF